MGFSSGPGGSVFVKIDDNTNGLVSRMLLLDVPTMGLSVFATNEYFAVAGETAGAYSAVAGGAITVDTSADILRFFAKGSVGAGNAILVPGISGNGGGEHCQLIPIDAPPACPADLTGDGVLDFFDVQAFLNAFAGSAEVADWNADGVFNFFDVQGFLNDYSIGCD